MATRWSTLVALGLARSTLIACLNPDNEENGSVWWMKEDGSHPSWRKNSEGGGNLHGRCRSKKCLSHSKIQSFRICLPAELVLLSAAESRTSDHDNNWPHMNSTWLGWEALGRIVPAQATAEAVAEEEAAAPHLWEPHEMNIPAAAGIRLGQAEEACPERLRSWVDNWHVADEGLENGRVVLATHWNERRKKLLVEGSGEARDSEAAEDSQASAEGAGTGWNGGAARHCLAHPSREERTARQVRRRDAMADHAIPPGEACNVLERAEARHMKKSASACRLTRSHPS